MNHICLAYMFLVWGEALIHLSVNNRGRITVSTFFRFPLSLKTFEVPFYPDVSETRFYFIQLSPSLMSSYYHFHNYTRKKTHRSTSCNRTSKMRQLKRRISYPVKIHEMGYLTCSPHRLTYRMMASYSL